jgi:hypothetical protein
MGKDNEAAVEDLAIVMQVAGRGGRGATRTKSLKTGLNKNWKVISSTSVNIL